MSVRQVLTAEELWALPETPGIRHELVDGEPVVVPGAGALHNLIAALVFELVREFVRVHDLGLAFTDGVGYVLGRSPDRVRIPDASFVAWERMPADGVPEGFWPLAPDLAVEVISTNDRADDVHDKVSEYLDAGARMVWVHWPWRRSVSAHTPDGVAGDLGPNDELDGGDVLPGFRVPVTSLFDLRTRR